MRELAATAARLAGAVIRQHASTGSFRLKGAVDLVTEVDLAAENAIREFLARETPDIPVLAEETGGAEHAPRRWIVDPLDGTTNFVHGYPMVAVSVALEVDGRLLAGCIFDPFRDEEWTAAAGGGAHLNGDPLRVSGCERLEHALLGTGFPYDRRERADFYLAFFREFMMRCQGLRRDGSAALDLCHVAAGRLDAFWEFGLQPWDVAAGALLVEEAGGRVTGMAGEPLDITAGSILASNKWLHGDMLSVLGRVLASQESHHERQE